MCRRKFFYWCLLSVTKLSSETVTPNLLIHLKKMFKRLCEVKKIFNAIELIFAKLI